MKKIISLIFIIVVGFVLSGCDKNTIDDKTIIVGASVSPHAEILEQAREYIESKGYKLEIVEYTDYIQPNVGVTDGSLDANFFQHYPYLEEYNEKNNTELVPVYYVHYEKMAVYQGKSKDLNLSKGATVGVPNDVTNEARALLLLDSLGLIEVDESKGLTITKKDILSNPLELEIVELAAEIIPSKLAELDVAVINGNVALTSKVADKAIPNSGEKEDSLGVQTYANLIAVQKGNENAEAIKILIEALQQESVKQYINDTYSGLVVPIN